MKSVDLSWLEPTAIYVVAVSGGVDSVVLLDVLVKHIEPSRLVVAHFDHGIRELSSEDARFVSQLAHTFSCKFVCERAELGPECSEELARVKRYEFLDRVKQKYQAARVILAHHQDDCIETAIINMLRGTGPRGLVSLLSTERRTRPFLGVSKREILEYAADHNLQWKEDPTNLDTNYLRNRVRRALAQQSTNEARELLLTVLDQTHHCVNEITSLSSELVDNIELPRLLFTSVDYKVRTYLCAEWLRVNNLGAFDQGTIMRLTVAICTLAIGKSADVYAGASVLSKQRTIALLVKYWI